MNEVNEKDAESARKKIKFFPLWYGGDNASIGFDMIPRILFKKQGKLGLSDGELNIFMHFLHGMSKGQEEKPLCYYTLQSPKFISNKTGKSVRQISREIKSLKDKGFI